MRIYRHGDRKRMGDELVGGRGGHEYIRDINGCSATLSVVEEPCIVAITNCRMESGKSGAWYPRNNFMAFFYVYVF
jgi:hypothetical protein